MIHSRYKLLLFLLVPLLSLVLYPAPATTQTTAPTSTPTATVTTTATVTPTATGTATITATNTPTTTVTPTPTLTATPACTDLSLSGPELEHTSASNAEFRLMVNNSGPTAFTLDRVVMMWVSYGHSTDWMAFHGSMFWNGPSSEDWEPPTDSTDTANDPGEIPGGYQTLLGGASGQFIGRFRNNPANLGSLWDLSDFSGATFYFQPGNCTLVFNGGPTRTPTSTVTSTPTITPTPTPTPDVISLDDFVALGEEGLWIKQGAQVVSGDVGANIASAGPSLAEGVEVTVGNSVDILDPASTVMGDSVKVKQGAQVYDVYYNDLSGQGQVLGQHFTPITLPLVPAFPTVPTFTPGAQDFDVPQNGSLTLPAGSYGTLTARKGSTITLTGSDYDFEEWNIGEGVNVYFAAPAEVRIAGRLDTDARTYVGPDPSASGLDASDIRIFVGGLNGSTGNLGGTPKAAQFGLNNTVVANVYAPNGTLWIRQGSEATGAFLGKWVIIGENVTLTLASAPTATATPTASPTRTRTVTLTPSVTPSRTPSRTLTLTLTLTPTWTRTMTPTP